MSFLKDIIHPPKNEQGFIDKTARDAAITWSVIILFFVTYFLLIN